MNPLEFTVELNGTSSLVLPSEIAAQLPKSGKAKIFVFTIDDSVEPDWQNFAYEQFLRDDVPEDALYESLE